MTNPVFQVVLHLHISEKADQQIHLFLLSASLAEMTINFGLLLRTGQRWMKLISAPKYCETPAMALGTSPAVTREGTPSTAVTVLHKQ